MQTFKMIFVALCFLWMCDARSPSNERYSGSSGGSGRGSRSRSSSGKRSGSYKGVSGKSSSRGRSGSYSGGSGSGRGSGSYNGNGGGSGGGSYGGGDAPAPAPVTRTCCAKVDVAHKWIDEMTGCVSLSEADCDSAHCELVDGDECPTGSEAPTTGFGYWVVSGKNGAAWAGYEKKLCVADRSRQTPTAGPDAEKLDGGLSIAVSCCELDGSAGARPDCDFFGKTYAEAVAFCDSHSYRLCTADELSAGKTSTLGCGFDLGYNWASTPCDPAVDNQVDNQLDRVLSYLVHSVVPNGVQDQNLIYVVAAAVMVVLVVVFYGCSGKEDKADAYEMLV